MTVNGNHYIADEGKVFSDLGNHALGTELFLGVDTDFEDNFKEINENEVSPIEELPEISETAEINIEETLLDFDYRISLIELGL